MIVGGGGGGGGSGICDVGDDKKDSLNLHASSNVYPVVRRFLTTYKLDKNCEETRDRFERLCRYLNKSMETEAPKLSYATLCLQKDKRCVRLQKNRAMTFNNKINLKNLLVKSYRVRLIVWISVALLAKDFFLPPVQKIFMKS